MLDFAGKPLRAGDNVAIIIPAYKELAKGRVIKITSEDRATVEFTIKNRTDKTSRSSRQLIKIEG